MKIEKGQSISVKRRFSQNDFNRFANLTGDDNPIHVDPGFCANTRFGKTVAHGMMLYGNICSILNSELPGPGTLQVKQEMMFEWPTFTDTEVTFTFKVLDVDAKKHMAKISTILTLPDGNRSCSGQTLVFLPGWKGGFVGIDKDMDDPVDLEFQTLKQLKIGQTTSETREFTQKDLNEYAELTKDFNPLFLDSKFAGKAGFKDTIIPGPLLSGMFSNILGTKLPGRGANWLKQKLHFPAPAFVGDEITARVEITRLRPDKDLVNLKDVCTDSQGQIVCQAQTLVLVKDLEQ